MVKTKKLDLDMEFRRGSIVLIILILLLAIIHRESFEKFRGAAEKAAEFETADCGSTWKKIFQGQVSSGTKPMRDRWFSLEVTIPTTYAHLKELAGNGCQFRAAKLAIPYGTDELETFDCALTGVYDAEKVFVCFSPLFTSTGSNRDLLGIGAAIIFDVDQKRIYYMPRPQEIDPIILHISLFTKK